MSSKNHDWSNLVVQIKKQLINFLEASCTFLKPWAQKTTIGLHFFCHDFKYVYKYFLKMNVKYFSPWSKKIMIGQKNYIIFFSLLQNMFKIKGGCKNFSPWAKNMCLVRFILQCFFSLLWSMAILLAEMKKNEESEKRRHGSKAMKKKGQILNSSTTVTYNIISSEKSKII